MNKTLLTLFLTGVLISCNKSDDNTDCDLIGSWKLIEVLIDPGDGSGTFHSVSSEKILEFRTDGTVWSNGSICDMSIESVSSSSGTYSLSDSTINSSGCPDTPIKIRFHKVGSTLTVSYPCDEACISKYVKK
ncbi:MAG: hypothetical protein JXR67_10645 [Bacteroidales bacterium]|nr:hypothetical protein [Bacteroidales bacterium]